MKCILVLLTATALTAQTWTPQASGTTLSLRGVSAVSEKIVWTSGASGTWLRTMDGGKTWRARVVPGAEALDFRGVRVLNDQTAWLMSSGPGEKSRIYKTTDGGDHWNLLFTNPDPKGFFDAIAFWDARRGIIAGDPTNGQMTVFTTDDGGSKWTRRLTPAALPDEGAFAASNSSLALRSAAEVWLATGGRGAARIFYSQDRGHTWVVAATPVRNDGPSAGIFSLAFSDGQHGVAVGGDYARDQESIRNAAITSDGGSTWDTPPGSGPSGFRSAVVYLAGAGMWLATGTSGSDVSKDGGRTWRRFDDGAYNALSTAAGHIVWAVGPKGRIAKLQLPLR